MDKRRKMSCGGRKFGGWRTSDRTKTSGERKSDGARTRGERTSDGETSGRGGDRWGDKR